MKRRVLAILVMVSMMVALFTACGNEKPTVSKNNYSVNQEFSMSSMLTIKGDKVSLEEEEEKYDTHKQNGFAYRIPEALFDIDGIDPYEYDEYQYEVDYIPEEMMVKYYKLVDGEYEEDEEDAIIDEIVASEISVFGVFRYDDIADKSDMNAEFELFKESFKEIEELASVGTDTFYFGCNREFEQDGLTDTDHENLNLMISLFEEVKHSLCLFPPVSVDEDFKVDLTSFNCEDLNGNAVDASIFADYDVTMINCWTTWCSYCIEEMPELAVLKGKLPSNYNVITICFDAIEEGELAKSLLEQAGATSIMTLVANDEITNKVGEYIVGYPTTFFVDRTGKVIGSVKIGAPSEASISDAYLELINKAYEDIK